MKNYKFGFDILGLALFFFNYDTQFIWFAIPAQHDILRVESIMPIVDTIESIAQVIMIICLCIFKNKEKMRITNLIIAMIVCCLLYFLCWVLYYLWIKNAGVILGLIIFPCLAFLFYSLERKKYDCFCSCFSFYDMSFNICNR